MNSPARERWVWVTKNSEPVGRHLDALTITSRLCHPMLIGDPSIFAIESEITQAFERRSLLALGFFALHVHGHCYGVRTRDATIMANSFDAVTERIAGLGRHTASFVHEDAFEIARGFRDVLYNGCEPSSRIFGMRGDEFANVVNSHDLTWAPDGDAAFDDGSYVLQFDDQDRVRLIAFRSDKQGAPAAETLRDIWLPGTAFYTLLRDWSDAFAAEWASLPKVQ